MSQAFVVTLVLLLTTYAAVSLPVDHPQPGYDNYMARDYRENKRDFRGPPEGPRRGRRGYLDDSYVYAPDTEKAADYEPVSS